MPSVLGSRRLRSWEDDGFLVLPGFFDDEEVQAVIDAEDRAWRERPGTVVDDIDTNHRSTIAAVAPEARSHRFKVNDLYLEDRQLREAAMSARVGMVLSELLGDEPVICNTLSFAQGSQQADHLDTLHMTPVTQRALVATWMALEDTHANAGPLRYYPGSNNIEPYWFETGSMHVHLPEMPRWTDHMAGQVATMGLEEQTFLARKGDLFIWHALLLHGGSEIRDLARTRRSLVTHYFTQSDCHRLGADIRPAPGGYWMWKPPLAIDLAEAAKVEPLTVNRDLHDRMQPLLTAKD
jgi:phytanoyl-CoA hydroxylase